jgi:hypothetical protein
LKRSKSDNDRTAVERPLESIFIVRDGKWQVDSPRNSSIVGGSDNPKCAKFNERSTNIGKSLKVRQQEKHENKKAQEEDENGANNRRITKSV